ncbi:ArsA-related P-loop ATPase [Actinomycetota bacterium]
MRLLLHTGAGGVGTTTAAGAYAAHAAGEGGRALALSLRRGRGLADALGAPAALNSHEPTQVSPGLFVLPAAPLDGDRLGAGGGAPVRDYLASVLPRVGLPETIADELTWLPQAADVGVLLGLLAEAESGGWDLISVDAGPLPEAAELLSAPAVLSWLLAQTDGLQQRIVTLGRAIAAAAGPVLPGPDSFAAVAAARARLVRLADLIAGPDTAARLVVSPRSAALGEAADALLPLALAGIPVEGLTMTPTRTGPDLPGPLRGIPLVQWTDLGREPHGAEDHAGLVVPQGDPPGGVVRRSVVETAEGYRLVQPVPGATATDVRLSRQGGSLVVTVRGHRAIVPLPAALRRCSATGASVREDRLEIDFIRDEEEWPRG